MSIGFEDKDHAVLICAKCGGNAAASQLRAELTGQLPAGFSIRAVNCMAGCDYPPTVGIQAVGKATYLFGEITEPADIAVIIEFSHDYQQSDNGWTNASQRPTVLYKKTLARIPAIKTAGCP